MWKVQGKAQSDWALIPCPESAILFRLTAMLLPHFHTASTPICNSRVERQVIPRPHRASRLRGFRSAGSGRPDEEGSGCRDSKFGSALTITEKGLLAGQLLDHITSRSHSQPRRSIKVTVSPFHSGHISFTLSVSAPCSQCK